VALDKLTMIAQQLAEEVGRSVKVSVTSTTDPDVLLASIAASEAAADASAQAADASAQAADASAQAAAGSAASISLPLAFSSIQDIATARLLGRASAGTGDVEELTSIPSGVDVPAARLSGTIAAARLPGEALITLGTSVNSTSGAAIDFTGFPAWAKRITVMFNGVSLSGSSDILVQIGDSGGIETTGYVSGSGASSNSTAGFVVRGGNATRAAYGIMGVFNFSGNNWVSMHSINAGTATDFAGGGGKTLSATLDRIRITTVNGTDTFDAGSINIMYEG
jgi:hypothetical protein